MKYKYVSNEEKRRRIIIAGLVIAFILISSISVYLFTQPTKPDSLLKFVSGTVYIAGERGQVIVRVSDRFGNPITNATCSATVIHPDKTYFFIDKAMQSSSIPGNYFIEFTTPTHIGLYEEIATCKGSFKDSPIDLKVSSSFQVSLGLSLITNVSARQIEQYENLVNKILILENKLAAVNTTIKETFNAVENNLISVNNTVAQGFDKTSDKLTGVESSINTNIYSVNDTVSGRFSKYYGDMHNLSTLMAEIFSNK